MAIDPRDREEPEPETLQKVPVVYYLSQNRRLEHPHFVEVPLSSPQGLYLRDVINRLNFLRGHGMANMYSWSSKRSYRNGYVWQDLSENDFIHPSHGNEYILKGSEIPERSLSFRCCETVMSSSMSKNSSETSNSSESSNNLKTSLVKRNSKSDFKNCEEYKIYKAIIDTEGYNDMSTQTDDGKSNGDREFEHHGGSADIREHMAGNERPSGRIKASEVLMQLVACGARKGKDYESVVYKD